MKILTKDGYKNFKRIVSNGIKPILKIDFHDGTTIRCTHDHEIDVDGFGMIPSIFLTVGDICSGKTIQRIVDNGEDEVFDVEDVEDNHQYIANGVTVSNCSIIYIDEFAYVRDAVSFYASTYPSISSSKNTQVILTSTPFGMNLFYKLWKEAGEGKNDYTRYFAPWTEHPERDKEWVEEQRKNLTDQEFQQEFECVKGDTLVEIKCDVTGLQFKLPIEKVYEFMNCEHRMFSILTDNGYKPFKGVIKHNNRLCYKITIGEFYIEGTENHKIYTDYGWFDLEYLSIGDKVLTKNGFQEVTNMENIGYHDVYDALEVDDGHKYYTNGVLSHNCEFLGSSLTLLSSSTLKSLTYKEPIRVENDVYSVYEDVKDNIKYFITVDVGEGTSQDYSVVNVIKAEDDKYEQVAIYRNNKIVPENLPEVIYSIGITYNNAYVVVENNSVGKIVADGLYHDMEYENIFTTYTKHGETEAREGVTKLNVGMRQTKRTKGIGCSTLKALVQSNVLLLNDEDTITELYSFVKTKSGNSYAAEEGQNDDTCMTLVMFAWLTKQDIFKELVGFDTTDTIREKLLERSFIPYEVFANINSSNNDMAALFASAQTVTVHGKEIEITNDMSLLE